MAVLLISYDLHESSYEGSVLDYIKGADWAMITKSSYLVITNKGPSDVVADLQAITKNKITVYVLSVRRPYSGYGPQDVNAWLEKNLPWQ